MCSVRFIQITGKRSYAGATWQQVGPQVLEISPVRMIHEAAAFVAMVPNDGKVNFSSRLSYKYLMHALCVPYPIWMSMSIS